MGKNSKGFGSEVFFGAPIFSNDPKAIFRAPVEQKNLFLQVKASTRDFGEITKRMAEEYIGILLGLARMGIKARIIMAHEEKMMQGMKDLCVKTAMKLRHSIVKFPSVDHQLVSFPRDLATVLSNGTILVDSSISFTRRSAKEIRKVNMFSSPYGQGGRILLKKNVALVNERLFVGKSLTEFHAEPPVEILRKNGLSVGLLPVAAAVISTDEKIWTYEPEDHLDRIAGLLVGQDKKLHLIVPADITGGFRTPDELVSGPIFSEAQMLSRYRQVCKNFDISLHIVSKVSVPGSLGFHQFADQRVLMTAGDEEVAELVKRIVGKEKVFLTEFPIEFYPVQAKASIRCLIGEFPALLLDLLIRKF